MATMVAAGTALVFLPSFPPSSSVASTRRSLYGYPFPLLSYRNFLSTPLAWRTHDPKGNDLFPSAASRRRQKGELSTDHYDDDEEEGCDDDGVEGRDEDGDGEMTFDKMRRWLQNKPVGFGEGKTYDVSLEDELMEEIERSHQAQVDTINKLKSSPVSAMTVSKKDEMMKADVPSAVVRVRVENLPKKKNIHKDLQAAFKVFPGIIDIISAVTGNKKTRDPVCKGFAFVNLKSKEAANRFVKAYSKQTLLFGKLEKQISCRIITPCAVSVSNYAVETQANKNGRLKKREEAHVESEKSSLPLNFHDKKNVESDGNKNHGMKLRKLMSSSQLSERPHSEKDNENNDTVLIAVESQTSTNKVKSLLSSSAIDVRKEQPAAPQQIIKKSRPQTASKTTVPGASNRLKMKERSVLTGVFTKYGGKAAHL